MFTTLRQNIKYSFRTLLKNPAFTITAVLTLALGISATTAIFSVVYTTLFEPLPYPKPDQLVVLWSKPRALHELKFRLATSTNGVNGPGPFKRLRRGPVVSATSQRLIIRSRCW